MNRTFGWSAVSCAAALSGCYDKGPGYVVPATVPCVDDESACHDGRAAVCREGQWVERREHGCIEGRCAECVEGARTCSDERTATVCEGGRLISSPCEAEACREGRCPCEPGAERCTATGRQVCSADRAWTREPCPLSRPLCEDGRCLACRDESTVCLAATSSQQCARGEQRVVECRLGCQPASGRCRCAAGADDPDPVCLDEQTSEVCDGVERSRRIHCAEGCDAETGQCRVSCEVGQRRCFNRTYVETCDESGRRFVRAEACDTAHGWVCSEGDCVHACTLAAEMLQASACAFVGQPILAEAGSLSPSDMPTATTFVLLNPDPEIPAAAELQYAGWTQTVVVPAASTVDVAVPAIVSRVGRHMGGAVRVASTLPLLALQLSPATHVERSSCGDADFLTPVHMLQSAQRYRVITPEHRVNVHRAAYRGIFAVASLAPETAAVQVELAGNTLSNTDFRAYRRGETATFTLAPDEAVIFASEDPNALCASCVNKELNPYNTCEFEDCIDTETDNLTGTLVSADRPVAVFTQGFARLPHRVQVHNTNQLVEQLPPTSLWGSDYVFQARRMPLAAGGTSGADLFVVVTDTPGTTFTIDPVVAGGSPGTLPSGGSYFTFDGKQAWHLTSSADVVIGRYFADGVGEFSVERPTSLWQGRYLLPALPTPGARSRLQVVIAAGSRVRWNGQEVSGGYIPGPPGHETLELDAVLGVHALESDAPFSILFYGWMEVFQPTGRPTAFHYSYTGPIGLGDSTGP